jgi:NAD(P)H-nitrite reductase large subunit
MKRATTRAVTSLIVAAAFMASAATSLADEWPLAAGDFWEVTGIDTKDGGEFKYAEWLATEWRQNIEFAKSKGWLKDAKIVYNMYPRTGEPDLYLIWIRASIPTGAEGEKRGQEFREWKKKTIAKMVGESGNRAEYREVLSSSLLQEAPFRD